MHDANMRILPRKPRLEVPLELTVAQLIAIFILPIVFPRLLDSVVGEVDVRIEEICEVIGLRGCPDVALVVPEDL